MKRRRGGKRALPGLALVLAFAAAGVVAGVRYGRMPSLPDLPDLPDLPAPATVEPTLSPGEAAAALSRLASLPVRPRDPKAGYSREAFGQRWADVDHNGCDTRNDILARDLVDRETKPGTRGCVVIAGTLHDPYTGRTLSFAKRDAQAVQIDHVVSLSNAWQTGAQALTPERRTALANDPDNLLAVDGPTNEAKGDHDAAGWLPPDPRYHCAMVARQVAVKAEYDLWVTPEERAAMARTLKGCAER